MKNSEDLVVRYLFGELSERERAELEKHYFDDPRAFDRLEGLENQLIDDYARGRLQGQTRERFERAYLSNPNRRERLRFAEALVARIDQSEGPLVAPAGAGPWWHSLLSSMGPARRALAFSMALALLLLAASSVWLLIQSRRLRAELARRNSAVASQEQLQAELQRQLADEQRRNQELTAELERASNSATSQTTPESATPAFVTLLLAASGVRGPETSPPPTLVIPKRTQQVRVQLTLKDVDYPDYQISLAAVGGQEISNRKNLRPRINKSGATFVFSLPAAKFAGGDYILTLRGVAPSGEAEDVSKSLFRVEKK